jgi:hypothetical protein
MLFRKVAAELFDGPDCEGISDGIERGDGGMMTTFSSRRSAAEALVIVVLCPFDGD